MPLYEFLCTQCQHREERIVPTSDQDQVLECPQCQGDMHVAFPTGKSGITFRFNYLEP